MGNLVLDSNYLIEFGTGITAPIYQLKVNIGDYFQGGIVIYTWDSGAHGIICSPMLGNYQWGCSGYAVTGTTSIEIGTGKQNTDIILSECSSTSSAAYICKNYNGGGYTDWFLPSKNEAIEIMKNRVILGIVSDNYTNTSTQWGATLAYRQLYAFGVFWNPYIGSGGTEKIWYNETRAVRYF